MTAIDMLDQEDIVHAVQSAQDVLFTWDYDQSRDPLIRLYEKAKTSQWNSSSDLPWETDVDPAKVGSEIGLGQRFRPIKDMPGSPIANFSEAEFTKVGVETQNFLLSQFLHGEQGALVCTAQIVETVPWIDAKYYAATQVMDEARHVEVFGRYLDEKLTGHYPITDQLQAILDDIITDQRWDITYLGMQIIVEGLALAAFGFLRQITVEPLLKQLLRYVMSDEARHVAFGVLSLQELYDNMSAAELRERQEFAYEGCVRMQQRSYQPGVWERLGVDGRKMFEIMSADPAPEEKMFQQMLFSKIVPNLKKLGLLDAGDGWLRERFTELNIIQFEDWVDTGEEYTMLDEVAKDRVEAAS